MRSNSETCPRNSARTNAQHRFRTLLRASSYPSAADDDMLVACHAMSLVPMSAEAAAGRDLKDRARYLDDLAAFVAPLPERFAQWKVLVAYHNVLAAYDATGTLDSADTLKALVSLPVDSSVFSTRPTGDRAQIPPLGVSAPSNRDIGDLVLRGMRDLIHNDVDVS